MIDLHNPHYGETGAVYDAVYYSGGAPANPIKSKKHMADIKLNLSRLNPAELIALAERLTSLRAPTARKACPAR